MDLLSQKPHDLGVDAFKNATAQAFGDALREARADAQISQEGLALASGIDRTFVSMLERGIRQPSLATVFILAESLNISPTTLIDNVHRRMRRARRVK